MLQTKQKDYTQAHRQTDLVRLPLFELLITAKKIYTIAGFGAKNVFFLMNYNFSPLYQKSMNFDENANFQHWHRVYLWS